MRVTCNATDVAWFAGVFEGEGSVYMRKFVRGKANTTHIHGGFRLEMTDQDVVERVQRIAGVGKILKRLPAGLGTKNLWVWQVQNKTDFEIVADLLRPYLGARRRAKLAEVESQVTWRDEWWRAAA